MKFKDDELSALREILYSDTCMKIQRADMVSQARHGTTANWIENFMRTMYEKSNDSLQVDSHLVNDKTGKPHTVETMVESLQERVGLKKMQKEASAQFPLSKKVIAESDSKKKESESEVDSELIDAIQQFISDMFSSHRGYVDAPAIIYALREKFGLDKVLQNQDVVEKILNETKDNFDGQSIMIALPTQYMGQPLKADPQGSNMTPIFEHIKGLG